MHPQFATNRSVYLYYVKNNADAKTTLALARARLVGTELQEVQEVFVTDAWIQGGPLAGRAAFGPDGMIYLTINDHDRNNAIDDASVRIFAQHLDSDVGKVLRLRDDGGIPADNPFVGREDANPQIFTYGHRNATDFAWHPTTGELWATEVGPMGGDELNILHAGHNYGWPLVSLGKLYNKNDINEQHWYREGMDMPFMYWTPSISPSTRRVVHGRQARAVAGPTLRRCAERPDAAARGVRSARAAGRAPRLAVHVARPALAPSRAEPRRLSLRRDREAHAGNAARSERRDERRRLSHRARGLKRGRGTCLRTPPLLARSGVVRTCFCQIRRTRSRVRACITNGKPTERWGRKASGLRVHTYDSGVASCAARELIHAPRLPFVCSFRRIPTTDAGGAGRATHGGIRNEKPIDVLDARRPRNARRLRAERQQQRRPSR